MRVGHTVSAGQLADALWRDQLPVSWAKVVQGCIMRVREVWGLGRSKPSARVSAEGPR
jgi:hypothetical protein